MPKVVNATMKEGRTMLIGCIELDQNPNFRSASAEYPTIIDARDGPMHPFYVRISNMHRRSVKSCCTNLFPREKSETPPIRIAS
jgi:hypothetical protein